MSKRLFFMLPDAEICGKVVMELNEAGISKRHMHTIAHASQRLDGLPKASILQKSEFIHGIEAGLGVGGVAGFLGGLLTVTFPPAGLALGGAAVALTALAGAGFGALVSGLLATEIPNHEVEAFEEDIEEGKVLLLVDVPRKQTERFIDMIKLHHPEAVIGISDLP